MTSQIEMLERAILDNPDEIANYAAYADCLTQQGNPRGELIQVQLALEDERRPANERAALKRRETELLEHAESTVGPWAKLISRDLEPSGRGQLAFPNPPFRFHRGILHEITLPHLTIACSQALVQEPSTRLVQRLSIGGPAYEPDNEDAENTSIEHLLSHWPYFANLRAFQLGWTSDENYGDFCDFQCHLHGVDVVEAIRRMPRLEELYLFTDGIGTGDLFDLPLDRLRVLQIYHCWEYPLEILADNPAMSNLTHLLLHPKAAGAWENFDEEGAYITFDGVRAILRSPHLRNLTHLRLRLTDIGDEGCEEIVRSGILKRLQVLDLRHGAISYAGAQILASCPDLRRLKHLDLKKNQLSPAGIGILRAAVPSLEASYQHNAAEIEGGQYLSEGDYE